ncbi:hypothetical protein [Leifsonia xyli]|uniref:hypothetical protein n=1 Tax=Leifsonia xyli TaxID=1575 RepID=UPI003D67D637
MDAPPSSAGGASWAAWLEEGTQFAIVLYGSSTCPPKVQNVEATGPKTIKAILAPAPGGICTRDFVPHTTVFATPDRIGKGVSVTVELPDATLTLPVREG